MLINATFIGTSSLGFETGKSYYLKIKEVAPDFQSWSKTSFGISILVETLDNANRPKRCKYNYVSSFLKNWKVNTFKDDTKTWDESNYDIVKNLILPSMRDRKLNEII
jgi:hypothetical protein